MTEFMENHVRISGVRAAAPGVKEVKGAPNNNRYEFASLGLMV